MVDPRSIRVGPVDLAYVDLPPAAGTAAGGGTEAPIVLLIHGFASSHVVNWLNTSWATSLGRAGYRVVAFDNRGHGRSTKLYDPAEYYTGLMADDAAGLLDALGIRRAHVMGYSMGARISAALALHHPERVRCLLLGGLGLHLVEGVGLPVGIADALEAPSLADVTDPMGRTFRAFAEQTKSDLAALAACIRGSRQTLTREEVGRIAAPTLVSIGTTDAVSGPGAPLAAMMPDARTLDIPGRDHNLAVGDRVHKEGVLAFLAERGAA